MGARWPHRLSKRADARGPRSEPTAPLSAIKILPMPRLSLRQPFNRRRQPLLTRLVTFCLRDPRDVFLAVARAEVPKRLRRRLVLLQGGGEIRRHGKFFSGTI